jgi:hypothetical protein
MTNASPPSSVAQVSALPLEEVTSRYRPYTLSAAQREDDPWVDQLELDTVRDMSKAFGRQIRLLVLYGSLRERSVH